MSCHPATELLADSNGNTACNAPSGASDEPTSWSKATAEVCQHSEDSIASQNQMDPETVTPQDETGDMQAEIKRLKLQIQNLKERYHTEQEGFGHVLEKDNVYQDWRTGEVEPPGYPSTQSQIYFGEKADHNMSVGLDQVNALYSERAPLTFPYTREYYGAPELRSISITPMLNRVPWAEFQGPLQVTGQFNKFAIDILVGEPEVKVILPGLRYRTKVEPVRLGFENKVDTPEAAANASSSSVAVNPRKPTGKPMSRGQGPLPERIRINSPIILRILSKIYQDDISTGFDPILMMRPFRSLVWYKDDIRKERDDLEEHLTRAHKEAGKAQNNEEAAQLEVKQGKPTGEVVDTKADVESFADQKKLEAVATRLDGEDKDNSPQRTAENIFNTTSWTKDNMKETEERLITEDDLITVRRRASLDTQTADDDALLRTQEELDHLNCLVDFIDHDLEDKLAFLASKECTKVAWSDIWHLIKPGDFVVSKDEKQAYRVIQVNYATHIMKPPTGRSLWMSEARARLDDSPITIQCAHLDFDGEHIGPVTQTIDIHRYEGQRSIRSLPVVPLQWASSRNLKDTLIKRGSMFIEVCDPQRRGIPMHYSGLSLETQEEIDSQVVIDFEEAFAANDVGGKTKPSGWTVEKLVLERFASEIKDDIQLYLQDVQRNWKPKLKDIGPGGDSDAGQQYDSSDSIEVARRRRRRQQQTCLPQCCSKEKVHDDVFVEHNRTSEFVHSQFGETGLSDAKLDVTYLGPMKDQNTFDLLILPPGHREMVESLVTQHFLDKASAAYDETDEVDIVRGKGDLGSTADVVESRLEKNFALASRWGCILLIDEADVFLEARQTENFDRNSLVAVSPIVVFLRTLEYYTGILFLTTNRVGTFDEAFTSRVHISLYYPPLSQASTLAVFQVNLTRIQARFEKKKERGEAELELDERSINEFILDYFTENEDARWNGRQIRNACQTALALAEFEGQKLANPDASGGRNVMEIAAMSRKMIKVKLTKKHFRDVANAYLAFMKYLREVHGFSAAQQAKNFRLRHDRWGLGESASLLASRQRVYGGEGRSKYGQRYGARSTGRTGQQARGQRYRQEQNMDDEDIAYEYGYADNYHGHQDDQGFMQDDDDGRDFENLPLFDEEDDYDEGYEDRPSARGKQTARNYDDNFEDHKYYPDEQHPTKHRPGPSQAEPRERYPVRGGSRGRGPGRSQQPPRRGDHIHKGRLMPGAYRKIPPDEAD
ncbi:TOB3 (member of AAA-ATPase family) [Fusarium pseudoanthophilum]|uniref:TOB3 (Member of AAA-ATPase family) n=1 Tax=Fusarium pseudoanthophilum TaxID=48495 RepID=A0A8H5P7E9_9HYPO|nr:TOB3 (member of AAA-ATPase family) [Fusarium pseudoanthophilum]